MPISNLEDSGKEKQKKKPLLPALDGGWGWLVVFGSFLGHFVVGGMDRAAGIIYRELLVRFNQTAATTAGLTGVLYSIRYLGGPIMGALASTFTHRKVVISGGILSCIGFFSSAYAPNVTVIYFTWGVLVGLGGSMIYTPSLQMVSLYFDQRRATALGFCTSGTGVGSFCLPMFALWLIYEFGYTGCMTLLGAVVLHSVVAGALFIPLDKEWRRINGAHKYSGVQQVTSPSTESTFCSTLSDFFRQFRCKILCDPKFIFFSFFTLFVTLGFRSVAIILPHHAELTGIGYNQGVLALSLAGVCDTLSRIASGFIFDWTPVKRRRRTWYTLATTLLAISIASLAFVTSAFSLIFVSCLFGTFCGIVVSQIVCILTDIVGREHSQPAIGLLLLFRGGGALIGPPVAGFIKDVTQEYKCSFLFLAGSVLVAAFFLCLLALFLKLKRPALPSVQNIILSN